MFQDMLAHNCLTFDDSTVSGTLQDPIVCTVLWVGLSIERTSAVMRGWGVEGSC